MRLAPVRLSCQPVNSQTGFAFPARREVAVTRGAPAAVVVEESDSDKPKTSILGMIGWLVFLAFLLWLLWKWLYSMRDSGKVIIAITSSGIRDGAFGAGGIGALNKATLSIDRIQMLPAGQNKNWIDLSNGTHTIDLLSLRNSVTSSQKPIIVGNLQVPPDQYSAVRFHVNKVVAEGPNGAELVFTPGNNVQFEAAINVGVKKDSVTTIVLDIGLDESLRDAKDENGNSVKVFAPVIRYEVRGDSQVTTGNKRLVFQKPGVLQDKGVVGMDINGVVEKGVGIAPGTSIGVNKGKVVVTSPPARGDRRPSSDDRDTYGPSVLPPSLSAPVVLPQRRMGPMGTMTPTARPVFPPLDGRSPAPMDSLLDSYPDISDVVLPQLAPAFINGNYNRLVK